MDAPKARQSGQQSFQPLTIEASGAKNPASVKDVTNEIGRVAASPWMYLPDTIPNLICAHWNTLKQSPDELARTFMTFVINLIRTQENQSRDNAKANRTRALFPTENEINAAWNVLTKTASEEMQRDIASYRNPAFSAHSFSLYLTHYLDQHADKLPSIRDAIATGSLTIDEMKKQIQEMHELFPKHVVRFDSYIRLSSETACLGYLEHCVSGALTKDYVGHLTGHQSEALHFSDRPSNPDDKTGIRGDGLKKYFPVAQLPIITKEKINFDFDLLDIKWIQQKIDNRLVTFLQLTQLSEAGLIYELKDSWIQSRIDKGDITFEKMCNTPSHRFKHLTHSSVQWCIDNKKMTIQDAIDAPHWKALCDAAEAMKNEKQPCIIS